MARYRIHRIKPSQREQFRWAAHAGGLTVVKPKDYDADGEIEASTPYAAWAALQAEGKRLATGDLLETLVEEGAVGPLLIVKYIGVEPAKWFVPEPKPEIALVQTESLPAQ